MSESVDDVLAHYGVKGMKWGVRKSRKGKPSPASEDATKAAGHRKTVKTSGTKALSNKELQELVTRMNLEAQYSTLTRNSGNVAKIEKGLKVAKTLTAAGTLAVTIGKAATSPTTKRIVKTAVAAARR